MAFEDKYGVLKGPPKTKPLYDRAGRVVGFQVTLKYLSPLWAKTLDTVGGFIAIWAFLIGIVLAANDHEAAFGLFLVAIIGAILYEFDLLRYKLFRALLPLRRRVIFKGDTIRFKGKPYARDAKHYFELLVHDNAWSEAKNIEQEFKLNRKHKVLVYYHYARHVVLRFDGQRKDIATVYGVAAAEQCLVRLQQVDAAMETLDAHHHEQRREDEQRRRREGGRQRYSDDQRGKRHEDAGRAGGRERRGPGSAADAIKEALAVFELGANFDCETLKQRFRAMAQKLHPEKGGSTLLMAQINNAYRLLKAHRGCR
jgi:hypothetical protein